MSTAGPLTAPTVLADHACGTALTMNGTGVVAMSEKRSFSQPSPFGTVHASSCTLASPQDFIWLIAQVPAFFTFGDVVSRGPLISASQLMMSVTSHLLISSDSLR